MKNQLDYSEFIERYLDGDMGEMELVWFKKEIESNPALQREISLRERINHAIADKKLMTFTEQLEEAYLEVEKNSPVRKYNPVLLGSVVASVLVGAFILLNVVQQGQSNQKIFEKYYKPYESTMTFRSSGSEQDNDLNIAMKKYQNGDYKGALVLFEKILKEDPSKVGLNFYSGISHMEEKNYDNAGNSFNKVIENKYSLYFEQAEWYLALCYLITGKDDNAAALFEKIASKDGYYHKQAKKALKKMK